MLWKLVVTHEPEIACEPAGPAATCVCTPFPVTGAPFVLLLSVNSNAAVFPPGATVTFDVVTVLPAFLSVSSIVFGSTTLIATVSKYGCPLTAWSVPSALMVKAGVQVLQLYMPSLSRKMSGFFGICAELTSAFHVPSIGLSASAEHGATTAQSIAPQISAFIGIPL